MDRRLMSLFCFRRSEGFGELAAHPALEWVNRKSLPRPLKLHRVFNRPLRRLELGTNARMDNMD